MIFSSLFSFINLTATPHLRTYDAHSRILKSSMNT